LALREEDKKWAETKKKENKLEYHRQHTSEHRQTWARKHVESAQTWYLALVAGS
jgi:hypothetical protein